MIDRQLESEIAILRHEFPIVAILGPRQSGKTTLAKKAFPDYEYVSLEDIDHREFADRDPRGFLSRYTRDVIFDEIQRVPHLMSYLQSHVDKRSTRGEIVITGSHNFLLMEQISQSLAGRVGLTRLLPFSWHEMKGFDLGINELLFSGSYPRIYDQRIRPETFYKNYISTYIEKDIRQIKQITKIDGFMKFLRVLAGRTGQELNLHAIAEQCGVVHGTIREWVAVLEAGFLVFRLPPYHKNYNKRIVKNPKIYFTDTGLVCSLLGIRDKNEVDYHFMRGALFETFVVNELIKNNFNYGEKYGLYFWRDNHQKEMDVIVEAGTRQYGIEVKSGHTVHEKHFAGLRYWLGLAQSDTTDVYLVYGGTESHRRSGISVVGWKDIHKEIVQRAI